jgi:hypothetical protein
MTEKTPLPRAKTTASTQLLLRPEQRQLQTILAVASGNSLAEIGRKIFDIALPLIETDYMPEAEKLRTMATHFHMEPATLAGYMITDLVLMEDLKDDQRSYAQALTARDVRRAGGAA